MQKVFVTRNYCSEWELYETSDPDGLKDIFRRNTRGENIFPDPAKYKCISHSDKNDDIDGVTAMRMADVEINLYDLFLEYQNERKSA